MSTKTCPSCQAEVPLAAARCKECFHDFNEIAPKKAGPLVLLGALAAMAVIGATTFYVISLRPLDERILVDEQTQSVVWTTTYRSGPQTVRLKWTDIIKLEHVTSSSGTHEIVAVSIEGERHVIEESEQGSLRGNAEHYARMMDKPLDLIDNTRGFHKSGTAN
ncbi:MAG: hypothetical protein KC912_06280 [Proteobacteria bacterium]|nr:hypothetical protein [Pseudomonadota bacterium]